jgi:acetyl esterase/lipase
MLNSRFPLDVEIMKCWFCALLYALMVAIPSSVISAEEGGEQIMTAEALAGFPNPAPTARFAYGEGPLQFADLRLPPGPGPHSVMILIHGGCWLSEFDITHMGKLADGFAQAGIATWAVEYRRVGDEGGGWPGTYEDIASAADFLPKIANNHDLDLSRVIVAGHSAGGHLALWLAARNRFDSGTPFAPEAAPVALKGVLALAPAADLAYLHEQEVCGSVIDKLMGGSPAEHPGRYALTSATELVPLGLPQSLVIGKFDSNWALVGRRYIVAAKGSGDTVEVLEAEASGHFEMIDPDSTTWPQVRDAAFKLLK